MITAEEIVEIGQYNKPHGLKGEISATLQCDIDDVENFSTLISCMDGIYVPFFIAGLRPKTAHTVLLQLQGVESDKDVRKFVNKSIYVLRRECPDHTGDVYCDYFVGFRMVAADGGEIGEIVDVDDSTENALFVVRKNDGREIYIPVTQDFIEDIDEDVRLMVMNLPHGMVDLQTD